ncbi:MAG: hypothetical protein F6K24_12710 [Okeania sp. SIO2D1]|nr:hypothetical protein [Okeania sp. SIO2D1]
MRNIDINAPYQSRRSLLPHLPNYIMSGSIGIVKVRKKEEGRRKKEEEKKLYLSRK